MILVGVIVALGVDRWVANLDVADTTQAYLEALRADFEANLERAEEKVRIEGELHALASDLHHGLAGEAEVDVDRLLFAAEMTGWPYREPYRQGAWSELNTVSGITLEGAVDLRVAVSEFYTMATYADRLETQWASDAFEWRNLVSQVLPHEFRLEIEYWFSSWDDLFLGPPSPVAGGDAVVRELAASDEIRDWLVNMIQARYTSVRLHRSHIAEIERVLELIDATAASL